MPFPVLDTLLLGPYGPRAFDGPRGRSSECQMSPSEPEDLRKLGRRLDAIEQRAMGRGKSVPQTSLGIAFRFSTEMVAALIVGGGMGYGIDWLAGTKPIFLIVFFVLGAAAGIRNVLRAAKEINAEMSAKRDGDTTP